VLKADGWIEAQHDMPTDAWYFAADRSGVMPLCVLLEIALQPCGWLAAYAGSALRSEKDLRFRNLGGQGTLHGNLAPGDGPLTMRTRMVKVSEAIDMIIENFEFEVHNARGPVYSGTTYFGFFTDQALAQQVGLHEAAPKRDGREDMGGQAVRLPDEPPFGPQDAASGQIYRPEGLRMPAKALRMIDGIDGFDPKGGPHGLGYVRAHKRVDPSEWFFKAHFYQDPVCPGSLGIESFLQLLKYAALRFWPDCIATHRFEMLCGQKHEWQYRGQVIPSSQTVTVEAMVTRVEAGSEPVIMADGWLQVDGLYIYKMTGFGIRLVPLK
jgi:3-hydroxymyristoyl/3-hydroxydecanoyl-(acyl carrier protein) dehydratase